VLVGTDLEVPSGLRGAGAAWVSAVAPVAPAAAPPAHAAAALQSVPCVN